MEETKKLNSSKIYKEKNLAQQSPNLANNSALVDNYTNNKEKTEEDPQVEGESEQEKMKIDLIDDYG